MTDTELTDLLATKVMGSGFKDGWKSVDGTLDWSPLTNIADAWMVVEKMVELGWYPQISFHTDGLWHAYFWHRNTQREIGEKGASICHAICEAAVKTVEGK